MTEESEDHDQRFKVLLETFSSDFVHIVAPNHAARLSLERAELLKQEVYPSGRAKHGGVYSTCRDVTPKGDENNGTLVVRTP
jgi:hypothetical protein